jgi:tellurium resistance protein TerD
MSKKIYAEEDYNFKSDLNSTITDITIRIEWDTKVQDTYAPLDIECGLLDGWGACMEVIDCDTPSKLSKAVMHMGDDLDQESDIDYEEIKIKLNKVENFLEGFVITVFANPFLNEDGELDEKYKSIKVDNCVASLINDTTGDEICKFETNANDFAQWKIIMCAVVKTDEGWSFKALGQGIDAESYVDIKDDIEALKLGRLRSVGYLKSYINTFKMLDFKYKLIQVVIWLLLAGSIGYNLFRAIKYIYETINIKK